MNYEFGTSNPSVKNSIPIQRQTPNKIRNQDYNSISTNYQSNFQNSPIIIKNSTQKKVQNFSVPKYLNERKIGNRENSPKKGEENLEDLKNIRELLQDRELKIKIILGENVKLNSIINEQNIGMKNLFKIKENFEILSEDNKKEIKILKEKMIESELWRNKYMESEIKVYLIFIKYLIIVYFYFI